MRRIIALVLILATGSAGCATARVQGSRITTLPAATTIDTDLMASYVRQLPLGSRVRVSLANGTVIRGTLMKADADPIVVQKRTRIPEAPLHIAIKDVQAVEIESKTGNPARNIAVGAAAGAAAALGVLRDLAAIFAGD